VSEHEQEVRYSNGTFHGPSRLYGKY